MMIVKTLGKNRRDAGIQFILFALIIRLLTLSAAIYASDPGASLNDLTAKANAGDSEAMTNIGILYGQGNGVPQDYTQALTWFHKAADAGNPRGALLTSVFFMNKATESRRITPKP